MNDKLTALLKEHDSKSEIIKAFQEELARKDQEILQLSKDKSRINDEAQLYFRYLNECSKTRIADLLNYFRTNKLSDEYNGKEIANRLAHEYIASGSITPDDLNFSIKD